MSKVDSVTAEGFRPSLEFMEDNKEALDDLNLTSSTELWLLKLPFSNDLLSEIDGQQLSLNLHNDGEVASFEGLNGKVYDFVSYTAQEPDETVFISSATEPKIAGKISRRVSIIHYPEPEELNKRVSNARQAQRNSTGGTVTTSRYFPLESSYPQSSQPRRAASSKGSRQKSSLSEVAEPSNTSKRSRSSQGHSTGISALSSDHSHGGKSKRKLKE